MHVIVTTDGSQASLQAARQFQVIADSREITEVTVLAVVSPYAAAPFANELGPRRATGQTELSYRRDAEAAVDTVAAVFDGWGPTIHHTCAAAPPPPRSSAPPRTSPPA